jgi:RND family efflux transporter MFP subunit
MMLSKQQQAQDAYDRLVKVHENGSLSEIKFVEIETGLQQAKSMTAVAKKNLDDCRMYAPRDGVIATRSVEVGASAMPATEAFKLVSVDKVFVKIPVPENEIGVISEGQEAQIVVSALDNKAFSGKIEQKGISANIMSHTYDVKIGVDNPQSKMMPGMVCKVFLADNQETTGITVPNRTIQIAADGTRFVWLAEGNIARRRFVEIGDLTGSGIIVAKGLMAGDKIIVDGFSKISEGMKIRSEP